MYILGITTLGAYNQAACLLKNNEIIAFAEEERFSRVKQSYKTFPCRAIGHCLESAGIEQKEVGKVAIGWDTARNTWEKCLGFEYADNLNKGLKKLQWFPKADGAPQHEIDAIDIEASLVKEAVRYGFPIEALHWYDHHECHAVSAISCSPFKRCNYITIDGDGGASAGRVGFFKEGQMSQKAFFCYLGSVGYFYEEITKFLGFKRHQQEGKTMGLASYGKCDESMLPRDIIFINKGGLWQIDQNKTKIALKELEEQGVKKKIQENILCEESVNLARTAQQYLEEILVEAAKLLYSKTGCGDFALAGGSTLNCSANGKLIKEPYVDNLFIPPAAHDSGTALGAAILASAEPNGYIPKINFSSAYWGSSFENWQIKDKIIDFLKS